MHRIESKEDFTEWNKEVNIFTGNGICDLQDVFARSEIKKLRSLFLDMTQNEKHVAIFCIQKAMGGKTLIDFLNAYTRNRFNAYLERENLELENRENAVLKRELACALQETELQGTIDNLQHQNAELVKDNTRTNKEASDLYKRVLDLENENEELETEINELRAFESHVKGLLAA